MEKFHKITTTKILHQLLFLSCCLYLHTCNRFVTFLVNHQQPKLPGTGNILSYSRCSGLGPQITALYTNQQTLEPSLDITGLVHIIQVNAHFGIVIFCTSHLNIDSCSDTLYEIFVLFLLSISLVSSLFSCLHSQDGQLEVNKLL